MGREHYETLDDVEYVGAGSHLLPHRANHSHSTSSTRRPEDNEIHTRPKSVGRCRDHSSTTPGSPQSRKERIAIARISKMGR